RRQGHDARRDLRQPAALGHDQRHVLPRFPAGRAICRAGPDHRRRRGGAGTPEAMEGKAMKAVKAVFRNPPLLTFVLVALVWLVASLTLRGFGAYGHLRYLLELAAVIGIVAAGQTLVILMGGIDLSVGAAITVTAILLPLISPVWHPTGLAGIVLALAIAAGIGLLNGAGAAYLRVPPIIMTLAMATFLQGLLVIVAGGSAVTVSNPAVILLGQARPLGIPAGVILWVVV